MSESDRLVAIIDYESGNLHSAEKAVARAIRESGDNQRVVVTADPDIVAMAERIILPGVGAFADCRSGLAAVVGMESALTQAVRYKGRPFLGICVGMQLLADRGLEHGETAGFGWIGGDVDLIPSGDMGLKVPHMGWNTLDAVNRHPLFDGVPLGEEGWHAYFVHSYHFMASSRDDLVAETGYGRPLTAAIARDNLFGTQFHPEKSQKLGLKLLSNFLSWKP
ncbi:MAG: imidazole glycerol phosphate synthase subunit HisH [Pseudomonadota bacterium]